MFDDNSYYSFKVFELLLTEPDLKDWINNNPVMCTSDFLTSFLITLGPFLKDHYLSPQMINNALNYLNLVRFNDDEVVEKIDDVSKNKRIELINSIIRILNSQNCSNYLEFYRSENYKRTSNRKFLTTFDNTIILSTEKELLESIKYDIFVLITHSNQISDKKFKQDILPIILSDLKYFKTINCILDEYPNQFLNPIFKERYNTVINSFLKNKTNLLGHKIVSSYNRKVANKIKI